MILLSVLLAGGCSNLFGESPREEADAAIMQANEDISEHNRLFEDARSIYDGVKADIEAGDEPSQQADRIAEASDTLTEARNRLEDAQASLDEVRDLDVDSTVQRYARLLSQAMDAQLAAEAREIEFYGILEEDPALEDRREEALDLLGQAGDDYQEAEDIYAEARDLADSNPDLIEASAAGGGG